MRVWAVCLTCGKAALVKKLQPNVKWLSSMDIHSPMWRLRVVQWFLLCCELGKVGSCCFHYLFVVIRSSFKKCLWLVSIDFTSMLRSVTTHTEIRTKYEHQIYYLTCRHAQNNGMMSCLLWLWRHNMCGLLKVATKCGTTDTRGMENYKLHLEPSTIGKFPTSERFANMLRSFISCTEHRHSKENENQLGRRSNKQTTRTNEFVAVNSNGLERRYLAKLWRDNS